MSQPVGWTFAVLSSRGSVNWLSGCSFIDAGRRITGDLSELTIQIECARNHARESAPISAAPWPRTAKLCPTIAAQLSSLRQRNRADGVPALPQFAEHKPSRRRSQPEHHLGLKAAEMDPDTNANRTLPATRLRPPEKGGRSHRLLVLYYH
jgi:hypothetical protein